MTIPNLKRIRISSEQELVSWLVKNPGFEDDVMLVTHADTSNPKYVSREQVGNALVSNGWRSRSRYTLNGNLIGHVISKYYD